MHNGRKIAPIAWQEDNELIDEKGVFMKHCDIELLAPAGSYESLKAAVFAGADAIYVGGNKFGARAYANNFTEEELLEAIDFTHLHGRKIYLTVNTLLKDKEMFEELYAYLRPLYEQGLDAVIVQDIGVLLFIREHFVDLPIHASTQMTITSQQGVRFLQEQGVSRVVLSRELSLREVSNIIDTTEMEIECFVHGALCYSYSGQCLFSSFIGGRSGNRGQCAGPCRLPYQVESTEKTEKAEKIGHIFSLKDICSVQYLPDLIQAGIHSLKIEGRMKRPEYVAAVVSIYRKYIDIYKMKSKESYNVTKADMDILLEAYNRGGFHDGYMFQHNGRDMLSFEKPNHAGVSVLQVETKGNARVIRDIHAGDVLEMPAGKKAYTLGKALSVGEHMHFPALKEAKIGQGVRIARMKNEHLLSKLRKEYIDTEIKEKINGKLILYSEKPATLVLTLENVHIKVTGDIVETAKTRPTTQEEVYKQVSQFGNTPFVLETLDVQMSEDIFVPMKSLKQLRREGVSKLIEVLLSKHRRVSASYEQSSIVGLQDITKQSQMQSLNEQSQIVDLQKLTKQSQIIELRTAKEQQPMFYVLVETLEQLEVAFAYEGVQRIYVELHLLERIKENRTYQKRDKEIYLAMPYIFREDTQVFLAKYYQEIENLFDGVLIRNYDSFGFLKERGYTGKFVTDFFVYSFNRSSRMFWRQAGVEHMTASLEMNRHELRQIEDEWIEMIVYGYLPMMVSASCIKKNMQKCDHSKEEIYIKDRYNKEFLVKNNCDYCYNVVYNFAPLWLCDKMKELGELPLRAMRLQFVHEDRQTMQTILDSYMRTSTVNQDVKCVGAFTRGHFERGVR